MKRLLNTLYVTTGNRYLSLDGENVVVLEDQKEIGRIPLHNLQAIVTFGYTGASPALMGACAQRNISLSFMSGNGRFLARVTGEVKGNVTLRKQQYRISDNKDESVHIARNFILGKVHNSRWILERAVRDHSIRLDTENIKNKSMFLAQSMGRIRVCEHADELLGLEGEAASVYFSVFDDLILQQRMCFISTEEIRDLLWIMLMQCCLLDIRCLPACAEQHWKRLVWIRMWDFFIQTDPAVCLWHWILWKNFAVSWLTDLF